jgi:signal transduction histidine kinase
VDGVLAVALAIGNLGEAIALGRYVLIPATLGLTVPVVFRRGHPFGAFAVAIATGAWQVLAIIQIGPADLAIVVLLYTLAAYTTRRISVIGLAVCLIGSAAATFRWGSPPGGRLTHWLLMGAIVFAGPSLIAWVLGDSMRYRRAYYANLEERAARLERDRDVQAQVAAAAERARIARELHDVVAHNVSVMVVQAGAGRRVLDSSPGDAREAMLAIEASGRTAMTELRHLLGLLAPSGAPELDGPEDQGALRPQPGLDEVPALVDRVRSAGLAVELRVTGTQRGLSQGPDLAAYRVVQEALTNVIKHADGARAQVRIEYRPHDLIIDVSNVAGDSGPSAGGTGRGLIGLRERIAIYGGSLEVGPRPGGGWRVRATIPLEPAAEPVCIEGVPA